MQINWEQKRKWDESSLPPIDQIKSESLQYRRDLTFLQQEAAYANGVPLYGCASVDNLSESQIIELRRILPNARAAVLIGRPVVDPFFRAEHRAPGIRMDEFKSIAGTELELVLLQMQEQLENQGFEATIKMLDMIPRNTLVDIFESSGAGIVGRNGMVLTESYGCRAAFGLVVTDAPLLHGDYRYEAPTENPCTECRLCEERCPAQALKDGRYDQEKCLAFRDNPDNQLKFSDHVFLKCDMCMRVCPSGRQDKWDEELTEWETILRTGKLNY